MNIYSIQYIHCLAGLQAPLHITTNPPKHKFKNSIKKFNNLKKIIKKIQNYSNFRHIATQKIINNKILKIQKNLKIQLNSIQHNISYIILLKSYINP